MKADLNWLNALGAESELRTPHPAYLAFGKSKDELFSNYLDLFKAHVRTELHREIRENINKPKNIS